MSDASAYILLAHGSSDIHWRQTFEVMCHESLQKANNVFLAYMELGTPLLTDLIGNLAAEGYKKFNVLPLFLAAGKHLRVDVPQTLAQLESSLGIRCVQHPPIGENPAIGQAIGGIVDQLIRTDTDNQ